MNGYYQINEENDGFPIKPIRFKLLLLASRLDIFGVSRTFAEHLAKKDFELNVSKLCNSLLQRQGVVSKKRENGPQNGEITFDIKFLVYLSSLKT